MVTVNLETDIQTFIAQYPWLLNINYQNIPKLKDNSSEMEYFIEGCRIDLILKDMLTGVPVLVEFKRGDLVRDNIGQILEYKARVISKINNEESLLYILFGNKITIPKLVLVVRSSDDYGRIACHLQNIELIEYGNIEKKIITGDVSFRKTVEDFSHTIKNATPAVNIDRNEYLETHVFSILRKLFKKYNKEDEWPYYRNYDQGEYWPLRDKFINSWYFKNEKISFGLYEDILFKNDLSICFSYYLPNREIADKLEIEIKNEINDFDDIINKPDGISYYILDIRYGSSYFYENVEKILDYNFKKYLDLLNRYKNN
jgi:hypothetical protein